MMTSAEVIHRRVAKNLMAFGASGSFVAREVALFALQVALNDLEEVWQDEYASVQRRLEVEQELGRAQAVALENMGKCLVDKVNELEQTQLRCDALEAECLRLRTNGSLSVMSAEMASCEPAVLSTWKQTDPMHPSRVESSSENDGGGERALSVRTLKRRQRATQTMHKPDESVEPSSFDWATALAGLLSPEQINGMETGKRHWGDLLPSVQSRVVLRIAETLHEQMGTISQTVYNRYKPSWASNVSSWIKTADLDWQAVLQHLQVQPSYRPINARIVRSDTSA